MTRWIVSISFTSGNSFLPIIANKLEEMIDCVNPLHVGELISTSRGRCWVGSLQECQSPSHRGTHFYYILQHVWSVWLFCVNPLHIGERISTWHALLRSSYKWTVSIPFTSGNAFLPSTLLFVDFMRVSSLDFRGIFQTILKTAVFSVTSTFLSIFYKRAEYEGHVFL